MCQSRLDSAERLDAISKRIARTNELWHDPKPSRPLCPREYGDLVTEEKPPSTWADFQQWVHNLGETWSFRGHDKETFRLEPKLERIVTQEVAHGADDIKVTSKRRLNPAQYEKELLL